MNSKILLSISLAFTSVVLSANPLFANPLNAQSAETQTPSGEEWADFPEIKEGFMQGCVGTDALAAEQETTKQNYCQCAFEAYAGRYSPQQFLQINTLANRAEENGPPLVNLMMAPELESCSATTGYQP